jgi:outer membrane immunogenic protein
MKKLLVAAAVAGLVGTANAQSAFEGFYGQVGVGYESVSASDKGGTFTSGGTTSSLNRNLSNASGFTGSIGLGYTAYLTKSYTLGIGAEYYPISSQNAGYTFTIPGVTSGTGQWSKENSYNIFLSPGVVVSKDSLAYAKIGYSGAQTKSNVTGSSSGTVNYTGYSLGLGYKQIINGGLYGFAEGNYFSYGDQSSTTVTTGTSTTKTGLSSYNFLVGVGYRF